MKIHRPEQYMEVDTSTTEYAESRVLLTIGSNQREWWTHGDILRTTRLEADRVHAAVRDLSQPGNGMIRSRGIGEAKGWKLSDRGRSYLEDAAVAKKKSA
jgi:hypothetical protein